MEVYRKIRIHRKVGIQMETRNLTIMELHGMGYGIAKIAMTKHILKTSVIEILARNGAMEITPRAAAKLDKITEMVSDGYSDQEIASKLKIKVEEVITARYALYIWDIVQ